MKKVRAKPGLQGPITRGVPAPSEAPNDDELDRSIKALHSLTAQQLRGEWRRLYRGQPPRFSRDLLIRSLAYRLQELALGGR